MRYNADGSITISEHMDDDYKSILAGLNKKKKGRNFKDIKSKLQGKGDNEGIKGKVADIKIKAQARGYKMKTIDKLKWSAQFKNPNLFPLHSIVN